MPLIPLFYHHLMFLIDLALLWSIWKYSPTTVLWFLVLAEQELLAAVSLAFGFSWIGEQLLDFNLAVHGVAWHGSLFILGSAFLIRLQTVNGKRRRIFPCFLAFFGLLCFGTAFDALVYEPTALEIKHYTITTSKITKPIKIVFIADIQTDHIGWYERQTLELVKKQNADMILLGGDYLQGKNKAANDQLSLELNRLLKEIDLQAPLGIFAVKGNQELAYNWTKPFEGTKLMPMERTVTFDVGELRLTILSMSSSFTQRTFIDPGQGDRFRIMVGHAPIYAMAEQKADLLLSGHTHGGQVRIPGYGPLMTASRDLPKEWASGITKLSRGQTLLVTNGTGCERRNTPRIRFCCRPNFWVIKLVPDKH